MNSAKRPFSNLSTSRSRSSAALDGIYEIQHAVEPDAISTQDGATFYEGLPVEIVGDTETTVIIEYAVRGDQLISERDFDNLREDEAIPDADDSDETEDTEE